MEANQRVVPVLSTGLARSGMEPLTPEEELQLVRAARSKPEARERLVKAHAALVVSIAMRFSNRGMSLLDLVQEGHSGLRTAVDTFDPEQGARLQFWASWWIKRAIRRALLDASHTLARIGGTAFNGDHTDGKAPARTPGRQDSCAIRAQRRTAFDNDPVIGPVYLKRLAPPIA